MLNIKEQLKKGKPLLGTWNSIVSASLVNVIGKSGLDFIVVDLEHGPASMHQAEDLLRAAEVCSVAPVIRVPANEDYLILRALDIGAAGVQVPHIVTREDAVRAVRAVKYHPLGERGYSPFTRAGQYGLRGVNHAFKANEETIVVLNVEGTEGINNLKDIVSVEGVDVIFIGPYDLSQSLGKPGMVKDPAVITAIKDCVKLTEEYGVACGSFAGDQSYLDLLIENGVQYITYGVDAAIIREAFTAIVTNFQNKARR